MAKITRRARFVSKRQMESTGIILLIFKGVGVSLVVSVVFLMFLALISLISDNLLIDRYMKYIMVGVTMISIFVGSIYSAQRAESKGLIIGMSIGVVYVLCSVAIGLKLSHEPVIMLVILNKCVAGVAAGALGGLVGVNL